MGKHYPTVTEEYKKVVDKAKKKQVEYKDAIAMKYFLEVNLKKILGEKRLANSLLL